ncbi:hypothetical protein D3C80_1760330 [compost metagenome]
MLHQLRLEQLTTIRHGCYGCHLLNRCNRNNPLPKGSTGDLKRISKVNGARLFSAKTNTRLLAEAKIGKIFTQLLSTEPFIAEFDEGNVT